PKRSTVAATMASIDALSETSTAHDAHAGPILARDSTAARDLAASRPATITLALARASPSAMPSPMPPLPPVTMATRPPRSNGAVSMLVRPRHEHALRRVLAREDTAPFTLGVIRDLVLERDTADAGLETLRHLVLLCGVARPMHPGEPGVLGLEVRFEVGDR